MSGLARGLVVAVAPLVLGCPLGSPSDDGGGSVAAPDASAFSCAPPCDCFRGVAAGETLTCALESDGSVWCWGAGPVGDGSSAAHLVPTRVAALSDAVQIVAG